MPDIVVMFFLLGLVARLIRSDLSVPKAAYDTLSLLLMLTIGMKGGMALHGNLSWGLVPHLSGVLMLGILLPLILFPVLRHLVRLNPANSASLTAHYGSVSAGTFAVAIAYAESHRLPMGGEVTLYLVLLELPAIILGLMLYRRYANEDRAPGAAGVWREALTNQGVVLLVGGVIIGWMYGPQNAAMVTELFTGAFKAVLALFLLEMGITAAGTLGQLSRGHLRVVAFALVAPTLLAVPGLLVGLMLDLPTGSTLVLASLTASASYIAAPTAVRAAIPDADIGLAMLASLGLTFPFNVLIGIQLYHGMLVYLS